MIKILWRLILHWRPYPVAVFLAFASVFGNLGFTLATPSVVRYAIDEGISAGSEGALIIAAALIVLLQTGRGAATYGQSYVGEYLSQHAAYDLRNRLYRQIQSLSFSFHDRSQTGQLMSRATADVENARLFLDTGLTRMVLMVFQFVFVAGLMLLLSWQLAILIFITLPLISWVSITTTAKLRPIALEVQQHMGAYAAVLQECLSGIRVVKAFTAEEHEFERFRRANWAVRERSLLSNRIAAFRQPMIIFFVEFLNVGILAYGGSLVMDDQITIGTLFAFTQYRLQLAQPVRQVGMQLQGASRAAAAAERVFEIIDTTSEVTEKPDAVPLTDVKGLVRYENVSFGYGKDFPVVNGVDIEARPGETVALLGPIGSGKTTVLNLLPRFYDATSGRVTIDGTDVRDVTFASLRASVGIVMQEAFLFNATLRENISYGRPSASEPEMIEAAKIARLHDFVMTLPERYETWVGERGITLSGGQRQRVAIARTLLLDPRILVLDDSTSSVDMETEYLIQQALADLLKSRTAFVIAHRIQTVRNADQILVLKDGRIAERGRHADLIAQDGLYREIFDAQLRDQEELAQAQAQGSPEEVSRP